MNTFNFSTDFTLENNRVQLRPLVKTDIALLLPFSLKEPSLWKYSITTAAGEEALTSYVESALALRETEKSYPFLVYDKQHQLIAGCTRFYGMDFYHKTLSVGYTWYGEKFQRTGLNRNCKLLLLTYAFEELKMERVEFRADARNKRSIEAMKAIGCTLEGTLRNNCTADIGRRDSVVLSILKEEWEAGLKQRLIEKIH